MPIYLANYQYEAVRPTVHPDYLNHFICKLKQKCTQNIDNNPLLHRKTVWQLQ